MTRELSSSDPVQTAGDSFRRVGYTVTVETTVAERIAWILSEKGWTERELARRAHLSATTINKAMKALQKDPEGIVLRTVKAIATAGGVSFAWLATGEGSPYARPAQAPDPWPSRTAGAALAKEQGVSQVAIASVLSEIVPPERAARSPAWWLELMRLREIELQEQRLAQGAPRLLPGRRQPEPTPAAGTDRVPILEPPAPSSAAPRSSRKRPRATGSK